MTNEAGLQFEGEPSANAMRYKNALALFQKLEAKTYHNSMECGEDWMEFIGSYGGEVELALKKMAKEKTNGLY